MRATDLAIATRSGDIIAVADLCGRPAVIAFLSKAACHTGRTLELLDQIYLEIGPTNIHCLGCIVDRDRDEPIQEYAPFSLPVGAASRRRVAEFLNISMSGFALPQFLILDRQGRQRLLISSPRGEDFWETVDNLKRPIEAILDESRERETEAAS